MTHILDRPLWHALTIRHADLGDGGARARRYRAFIASFAATIDDGAASRAELAALMKPDETYLTLQASPVVPPDGFEVAMAAPGVQMTIETVPPAMDDAQIERLTWDDAQAMLDLAELTKPGPFTLKSQSLGNFWGVRENGALIAMAGERMKVSGFTELSGVCTHPSAQGRGLARRLSVFVTRQIFARGEKSFLHAWAMNTTAIRLYESIGFRHRRDIHIAAVRRPA